MMGDTYDTHALPCGDQRCKAKNGEDDGQHAPRSADAAQCDDDLGNDCGNNQAGAQTTGEDHTGSIAIANGPADEVGVSLAAERVLDGVDDLPEC
jgi:hypothetical protein